jgi:hypothetical protein
LTLIDKMIYANILSVFQIDDIRAKMHDSGGHVPPDYLTYVTNAI